MIMRTLNFITMKNLFFVLAFMLIGTFAFANTNEVETMNENVTVENVISLDELAENVELSVSEVKNILLSEEFWDCFDFNDSCGGSWVVCHQGVSTARLVAFLWAWDGGC
jgi:hypothetical protein